VSSVAQPGGWRQGRRRQGLWTNDPALRRASGAAVRWLTFGVKLSARRAASQVAHPIPNDLHHVQALIDTMLNATSLTTCRAQP